MKNRSLSARFLRTAPAVLCAALMVTGLAGCVHVTVNTTEDASDTEEQLIADDDPMETDSIDQVPDIISGSDSNGAISMEFTASTDYYIVTMPASWYGAVEVEEAEAQRLDEAGAESIVSIYCSAAKENDEGGHIATIVVSEQAPEVLDMIPGEAVGILTEESSGRTLNVWIEYPSDVQCGPETQETYSALADERGMLAETFEPTFGWRFEPATLEEMMS